MSVRTLCLAATAVVVAAHATPLRAQASHAQASHAQAAHKLTWGPAPAVFPAGAKMAVISGDPGKAGPFAIQLAMPNGYRIMPHFHPTDENVTVKSGHFHYGMGDTFDAKSLKTMKPGESGSLPANGHHYASAQGRTVVEISSTGPFAMTYVHASDDPSKMQH